MPRQRHSQEPRPTPCATTATSRPRAGLLDFAVNVYDGPRPDWLDDALAAADLGRYPDAGRGARRDRRRATAVRPTRCSPTAGAAEAFGLVARLRPWRRPVVVHPQFTEPDVALRTAGHRSRARAARRRQRLRPRPGTGPADADLVVVGNPTNPTGVRHPAADDPVAGRARAGLVVVDEAFLDDGAESLAGRRSPGCW